MVCSVIYIISKQMWKTTFFFCLFGFLCLWSFSFFFFWGGRGGKPSLYFFTFTTQGFVFFFSFYHLNSNVLKALFLLALPILLFNLSGPFNKLPYSRQFPLLKLRNTVLDFLIILIIVKILKSCVKVDVFMEATKSKLWKEFHATILNH